jgi:hypothetical protein
MMLIHQRANKPGQGRQTRNEETPRKRAAATTDNRPPTPNQKTEIGGLQKISLLECTRFFFPEGVVCSPSPPPPLFPLLPLCCCFGLLLLALLQPRLISALTTFSGNC